MTSFSAMNLELFGHVSTRDLHVLSAITTLTSSLLGHGALAYLTQGPRRLRLPLVTLKTDCLGQFTCFHLSTTHSPSSSRANNSIEIFRRICSVPSWLLTAWLGVVVEPASAQPQVGTVCTVCLTKRATSGLRRCHSLLVLCRAWLARHFHSLTNLRRPLSLPQLSALDRRLRFHVNVDIGARASHDSWSLCSSYRALLLLLSGDRTQT